LIVNSKLIININTSKMRKVKYKKYLNLGALSLEFCD